MRCILLQACGNWKWMPARGGAVVALRHAGRSVLMSPGPAGEDAMGTASFVLVPYANRIAEGAIRTSGARVAVAAQLR